MTVSTALRSSTLFILAGTFTGCRSHRPVPAMPSQGAAVVHEVFSNLTRLPWPDVKMVQRPPGVTHLKATDPSDNTSLHLFVFDFRRNSRLHFALYDQDEDDAVPGDDAVDVWSKGLGNVLRHLNHDHHRRVISAWNGLFFATDHKVANPHGVARHVAPVVLNGKAFYNIGNHRWAFGCQRKSNGIAFKVLHLPGNQELQKEFTYAACGAQCLIRDGKPLRLQPFPQPGEQIPRAAPEGTSDGAGYIPIVDHMKTSRTSVAWLKDNSTLYLLIVKEPDSEMESALAVRHGQPGAGGWTLADLQRFWLSKKVWGAVNLDGGDITQAAWLHPDGSYRAVPPRAATPLSEITLGSKAFPPLTSGSIMYFYIWENEH
jgi:hypothetical protein